MTEIIIDFTRNTIEHLRAVWLFGSYANNCHDALSDMDIAILTDWTSPQISAVTLWDVSQNLACILNKDVDIVDMHRASTVMQYQIVVYGKRIFGYGLDIDLYECGVLRKKIALDELRAGFLSDILARGSVYAR